MKLRIPYPIGCVHSHEGGCSRVAERRTRRPCHARMWRPVQRCCFVGSADASSPVSGPGSDRLGEFGECAGDPQGGWGVESEFVVATSEVLHEGVSGDDHLCRLARS